VRGCDDVLARLDELLADGRRDPDLQAHIESCERCADLIRHGQSTCEGGRVIHEVNASAALKGRLKGMLRLPQGCERAVALMGDAFDSEIDEAGRSELLNHLHDCQACRTSWDALATLREVGAQVKATPQLHARLRLHPSQHVATHRRKRPFDLRLATAAAYLLAALTVALLGNPATVARASSDRFEKVGVYTRAAVENRFAAYSRGVLAQLSAAEKYTEAKALAVWKDLKGLIRSSRENPEPSDDVVQGSKGERS
jgi:hypothetical protein